MKPRRPLRPETLAVHADRALNSSSALVPPIYQTSTFRANSAQEFLHSASQPMHDRFYTRQGNPNNSQAAAVIAALEGAECALIFPSGMAALTATLLAVAPRGGHIVAQRSMYAGTHNLLDDVLAPLGIANTLVDQTDTAAFERALRDDTRAIIVETPSNPILSITDLCAVAQLGRERNVLTIADNTFATPVNQQPLHAGFDLVMHSATKYLSGHSDLSSGAVAGKRELVEHIWGVAAKAGFAVNGFDSWLLLRGLRTLALRVERENANALALAQFLQQRSDIAAVHYPGLTSHPQHDLARSQMSGFGGIVSFELAEGAARVEPFIAALKVVSRAASLGGVESTLVHQSAMWAAAMNDAQMREAGIAPGLIRLSAGIEHIDDLTADLESALEHTG